MSTDPSAPVTAVDFYAALPLFNNAGVYPPALVNMYLALAAVQLNYGRWQDMYQLGQMWFAAHFLTLDALDAKQAARGLAGQPSNPIASKSVGSVSVSYDTTGAMEIDAGHWNSTSFGRRFIRFARMAGMGGVQLNGGGLAINPGALFVWPGPLQQG